MITPEFHEIIISILGSVAPTIAACAAWYVALHTKRKVEEIHKQTNSMTSLLVETTAKLSRLEGFNAGVASMSKPTQSQDAT